MGACLEIFFCLCGRIIQVSDIFVERKINIRFSDIFMEKFREDRGQGLKQRQA